MTTVSLSRLLWSSRGKQWGFRFLIYPSDVKDPDFWLGVHDRTFGASSEVPLSLQGHFYLPNGSSVSYLAARFYDEGHCWRDDSGGLGRKIPHELLLLVDAAQNRELSASNWQQAVMDALRPVYAELYPLPRAEVVLGKKQAVLADQVVVVVNRSKTGPQPTSLDSPVSIAIEKNLPVSTSSDIKTMIARIAAVIALVVLLLGVAATALMLHFNRWHI